MVRAVDIHPWCEALCALVLAFLVAPGPGTAQAWVPASLEKVGFDQKLDAQVPLDLAFREETGRPVKLGDYFGKRPVILVLAYYRCPMLCTEVLNGLTRSLLDVPFDMGKEYEVITVSFDPREKPPLAAAKKRSYVERYGRRGAEEGWHFLTGEQDAITRLTDAVGFRYRYDAARDQFAHASGIMILTPAGKISRYFYDIRFPPRDVRLGLVEASENKIGTPVDQVLLFCFHYEPAEGKYGAAVMRLVRAGGALTVLCLATFIGVMWRHERKKVRQGAGGGAVPVT